MTNLDVFVIFKYRFQCCSFQTESIAEFKKIRIVDPDTDPRVLGHSRSGYGSGSTKSLNREKFLKYLN
jgi:hypothetical protein